MNGHHHDLILITELFRCIIFNSQDAYALCRVFKKSAIGPKIVEHYAPTPMTTANQMTHHANSPSIEYYSESSDYPMPYDRCLPSNIGTESSNQAHDGKWTQFLSEDSFGLNSTTPFSNYATTPYHPCKVKTFLDVNSVIFTYYFLILFLLQYLLRWCTD